MLKANHCALCEKHDSCKKMCSEVRKDLYARGGGRRKRPVVIFESQLNNSQIIRWNNRVYAGGVHE